MKETYKVLLESHVVIESQIKAVRMCKCCKILNKIIKEYLQEKIGKNNNKELLILKC